MLRPLLATGRVRFVGEPVAAIVAETETAGADAAALVEVDYEPLPVVVDPEAAGRDELLLFPDAGTNVVMRQQGGRSEPDAPAGGGDVVVVRGRFVNQRVAPAPLEGRAGAARWDENGRLTHWSSCQGAHPVRAVIAGLYGLPPDQVRVIAPDVGGSFGAKARPYPEELLLPWLARRAGRPVRWVSPRSSDMVGLGHARAQIQTVEITGRPGRHHLVGDGAHPLRRRRLPPGRPDTGRQHRPAAGRGLPHPVPDLDRGGGGDQHHAGGVLPGSRPPGGGSPDRAGHGPLRGRDRTRPGRAPPPEPAAPGGLPLPGAHGRHLRQRGLSASADPGPRPRRLRRPARRASPTTRPRRHPAPRHRRGRVRRPDGRRGGVGIRRGRAARPTAASWFGPGPAPTGRAITPPGP